jgi:GDPmannose 4,6-dehydratase
MTDGSSLTNIINTIINDNSNFLKLEIYNLAAQSHVQISFENAEYTSLVDGIGTLKLLETIKNLEKDIQKKIRFYQAGSSEMFGDVLEKPQTEKTPFNPVSPYACAKVYAHYITKNYREAYGLFACNGILFNHESPRRGPNFVTMKIVNGIKKIMNKEDGYVLTLGNLDSKRDWGHSKDYVYGMWLMLQKEKADDYILATGKTYSVREFVERAFNKIGINIKWEGSGLNEIGIDDKTNKVMVKINEKYFRPYEVEYLLGDPSKAESILNWKREYDTLDKLIDDMFL